MNVLYLGYFKQYRKTLLKKSCIFFLLLMGYFTLKILMECLAIYKDTKTRLLNTRRYLSYESYFV